MSNTTPPPEPKPGNAWYKIGKEEKVDPNDKRNGFERFVDSAAEAAGKVLPLATGALTLLTPGAAGVVRPAVGPAEEGQTGTFSDNKVLGAVEQLGVDSGSALSIPYRQYVARPLSTAFLSANKNYQKQGGTGFFDTDTWARGWKDAQHVSPGQAIVGFVGADLVDGTQGSDKIDWTNAEEVHAYFSYGPQRWISFGADTATGWFLDPYVVGGKAVGKGIRKYGNVPVNSKNLPDIIKGIDDAAKGEPSPWSSTFEFYKRNRNNPTATLAYKQIAGRTDLERTISSAAERAVATGNDEILAEAIKVAVGDPTAVERALYDSTYLADDLGVMTGERNLINQSIGILKTGETELLNGFWTHNSPLATRLIKDYREKRSILETRMSETRSELDVIDRIANQPPGAIQRVTVSRFEGLNLRRQQQAERFADSYWHTEDVGNGARVLHYFEPSSMLHEKASNFAELGPIAGDRSHIEFAARLREWAKLTGRSMKTARKYYEIYSDYEIKTSRWDMLESFNEKAMRDIIINRLKKTGTIAKEDQELVIKLADVISKNSKIHKRRVLEHVVDNNYMIHDGSGSHIFVKQMSDYEAKAAREIAEKRAGKGAEVTEQDLIDARKIVKDSLSNIQTGSSQIPNLHYSTDLKQFDNIIAENASGLRAVIEEAKKAMNQGVDPETLWNQIAGSKSNDLFITERIQKTGKEFTKQTYDTSITVFEYLYNDIWKPVTLASLHYTSRNVFEGWQRVVGISGEMARDTGMSHFEILKGAYSKGVVSRTFKNRKITYDAKKAQKVLNRAQSEIAGKEYQYNKELADSLYASSDSFLTSIGESAFEIDAMLEKYNRYVDSAGSPRKIKTLSGYPQSVLDHMESFLDRIADTKSIPSGVSEELYSSIANLDHLGTFEIIASTDSKLTLTTLAEFQKRLRSEIDYIDNVISNENYASLPPGMQNAVANTRANLNNADIHIGSITTVALAKASVRGQIEELIGKTDILGNIERSAGSEFEVIPGLNGPDAFAGVIGAIMRKETDAVLNSTRTVFNMDRATTQNMLNGRVRTGVVNPFITKADGVKVSNPGWAEVAADHVNNRLRDASIQRIVTSTKSYEETFADVLKWAKGPSRDAKNWRDAMRISIGQLKEQGLDPIAHLIERNMLFVEGHLPKTGLDGQVVSPMLDDAGKFILDKDGNYIPSLRQKALDGELTAEDMLAIPESERVSVTGNILEESNLGKWKTFTSFMLKNLGSKPETFLARHPFYTMMYRAEYRRVAQLWQKQGRSLDYLAANEDALQQAAHTFAYKSLMEKMYSVERRTEPGEFMRFLSPFYMAKQNSNRFWLGYAQRNPQFIARYFLLYSAPGRVFDVEDENGKDVEGVNPFAPAGASIKITLPEAIANKLGIPKDARLTSQLSSWDLINNGALPLVPEIGGPITTFAFSNLFNKLSGSKYDPELFLANLGVNPNLLQKRILPFYQKQKQESPRDTLLNIVIDVNSWMSSALKAGQESNIPGIGFGSKLIEPSAQDAFNSRVIKNYIILQEEWTAKQDPNKALTVDQQSKAQAELLKEAAGITSHEYILESFFAFAPTVGNLKIEDKAIRMGKELRQYQKQFGQDEGKMKYIQFLVAGGASTEEAYRGAFVAQYKPRQSNQYGLVSTPQTVRNILQNKDLFEQLSGISKGADAKVDNKLIGALFNGGDPLKHYTQVADSKLFTTGYKIVYNNPSDVRLDAAYESANSQYFAVVDYFNAIAAAQNPPIKPGSDAYRELYKPKIEEEARLIENKNPAWKFEKVINLTGSMKNVEIINIALKNDNFMKTAGKSNNLIPSIVEYMSKRTKLVEQRKNINPNPKSDIYNSGQFSGIVIQKEDIVSDIVKKNPDFQQFYNYYLSRDQLLPVG